MSEDPILTAIAQLRADVMARIDRLQESLTVKIKAGLKGNAA